MNVQLISDRLKGRQGQVCGGVLRLTGSNRAGQGGEPQPHTQPGAAGRNMKAPQNDADSHTTAPQALAAQGVC